MENQYFFFIIILVVLIIYWIHSNGIGKLENFEGEFYSKYDQDNEKNKCSGDLLTLNPYVRCETLSKNKFMIRDIRTRLWLISGQEEGFSKFLPGNFGIPLILSENPDEYLPLRTIADPNDYLLSTYNGKEIRVVSNPYTKYYVLQIFIYDGYNIIGYVDESEITKYFYIDNDGHITSTVKPEEASQVEMLFV